MVLKARISVRHSGGITERLPSEAYAAQLGGGRDGDLLVMHGTPEQMDDFVAEVARAQGVPPQVLKRTTNAIILRGRHPGSGVLSAIDAHGCTVLWPAFFRDGRERYRLIAPDRAHLDDLLKELRVLGETRLERVVDLCEQAIEPRVSVTELTSDLTRKQLAVLRRAIDQGYYGSPRRTSSEALARSFGLSRSTFDEHLRKAESRVLERFAEALREHPDIDKAVAPERARAAVMVPE